MESIIMKKFSTVSLGESVVFNGIKTTITSFVTKGKEVYLCFANGQYASLDDVINQNSQKMKLDGTHVKGSLEVSFC